MKQAIFDLKDRMESKIDLCRGIVPKEDIQDEIGAFVKAINELEKFYYGEAITRLDVVLSDYEGGF
ncbi:hypothetical protein GCM10011409_20120 [Lentibacillus populi]|uniref:Uncharacterized protein n=1 Tax=Lentibacillus populi TaxID=1827502 RepID=A0A9W5TXS8_9BACI|nr:hypothetical protein [Lentibacillus populi]GGB42515.1 hypothetical protein GCM10011409_20120 [Lentibacillus populi]